MAAEVAAVLHQPLPLLLAMPLDELAMWHAQAARIEKLRHGGTA